MDKPVRTRKRAVLHTDSPGTLSTNTSAGNDPRNALALAVAYVDPATLKPPPRRLQVNGTRQMAAIRDCRVRFPQPDTGRRVGADHLRLRLAGWWRRISILQQRRPSVSTI